MKKIEPYSVIGLWTVQDSRIKTPKGETKWLCRCECGTQRYVLERSLIYGGSSSCGCAGRAKARQKTEHDLLNKRFCELQVLQKAEKKNRNGGTWWVCRCSCGNIAEVPGTLLVTGRKTHCGCKSVKNYFFQDITDKTFGRLTAKHPLPERTYKGGVVWHCECSCGNEVAVPYDWLVYSGTQSCGCKKREHDKELTSLLTFVDGTSLNRWESDKLSANNTTGARGVYFIRGKWVAKIVFQKKAYHLGTFSDFDEAVAARQKADRALRSELLPNYKLWEAKAAADPVWAENNPFSIKVTKVDDELMVLVKPILKNE